MTNRMKLSTECRQGRCGHAAHGVPCMLQEPRCLSGECSHGARMVACPTALPDQQPAHRRPLRIVPPIVAAV